MKTFIKSLATALLIVSTASAQSVSDYNPFVVGLSGSDVADSSAIPQHSLGIPYWGAQGVFVYGEATEAINAGAFLIVDHDAKFTLADTVEAGSTSKRICVAGSSMTTASKYGWAWCGGGAFEAFVASGVTAGSAITTTATNGVAGSGGTAIVGCTAVEAGINNTTRVKIFCSIPSRT
jgi:hypothetical protein